MTLSVTLVGPKPSLPLTHTQPSCVWQRSLRVQPPWGGNASQPTRPQKDQRVGSLHVPLRQRGPLLALRPQYREPRAALAQSAAVLGHQHAPDDAVRERHLLLGAVVGAVEKLRLREKPSALSQLRAPTKGRVVLGNADNQ
eukprot:7050053-Pyramimonas_sp.AAC.2